MLDQYGGVVNRPTKNPYGGVGGNPNEIDNIATPSNPGQWARVGGNSNDTTKPYLYDANGNHVTVPYGGGGGGIAPSGGGGGGAAPTAATTTATTTAPAAVAPAAVTPAAGGLGATASKAIPWLELLYGIYKGQQKGSFVQPPTSAWQDKIFGKYYDWMTGGSPTNAALSPAILEMMKSTNPEFTLPNLIGPEAGKNVLPNGGHVGGANVDWNALLSRLTASGGVPAAAATPNSVNGSPVDMVKGPDGVFGKKYDWMTP